MRAVIRADAHSAGREAARIIRRKVMDKPDLVLGLATGHTMIPVYGELVRLHQEEGLSLSRAATFNLDEYVGVGKGDYDSFHEFMLTRLVGQVDIAPENFHMPDGKAPDPVLECERYEELIRRAGGIDLQALGLGRNGHVGFNEPGSARDSRTRIIDLSLLTRDVNSNDFRIIDSTPARAITMGVATILEAKQILLVVTGWEKSGILARTLTTPPTPDVPATFLHDHPAVTLVADLEAMEEYFRLKDSNAFFGEIELARPG